MVARVVVNQNGMKVSKPGLDVLTAGAANLQFSSDWSAMGVIQSGVHTINSWGGNSATDIRTIAFNKTFASPPFCAFFLESPSYLTPLGFGNGFSIAVSRQQITNDAIAQLVAQVSTSGILVSAMFNKNNNTGVVVPSFVMRYFVFDNNM